MEIFFLLGFLVVIVLSANIQYQPTNAANDFPSSQCPNQTLMDGLCVRAYARVDVVDEMTDEQNKFQYLIQNYCSDQQTQPITCAQYQNSQVYDNQSLSLYQDLLKRFQDPTLLNGPSVDCLGIARFIKNNFKIRFTFCAYQFAYCDPSTGLSEQVVCQFICDTWLDRCPGETQFYNLICNNTRDSRCSVGLNIKGIFTFIALILNLIFIL